MKMATVKYPLLGLACLLLISLTACGGSPPTRFYTLAPLVGLPTAPNALPTSLHINPVSLPETVDRPQLVMAVDRHQVRLLENHRWAESLKSAIPRIIADNLSRLLATDRVSWHPHPSPHQADYRITVDFRRFEGASDQVTIDALWSISRAGNQPPIAGRSLISQPLADSSPEALAAAYSQALAAMSNDIAHAVTTGRIGRK